MDPRRIAALAAVVGGVGWLVKVGLIWANGGTNLDEGLVGVMYVVGLLGLVVALGAAGYTLVEKAPVWLRAIVVVATPLLVMMVWMLLDEAVGALFTGDGWFREEVTVLATGLVALGLGAWGLRNDEASDTATPPATPTPTTPTTSPARGRRAAR